MLDAPSPVSTNIYTQTKKEVCEKSHQQALKSMKSAIEEISKHYGAASSEEIVDILVSCDGTWQKGGFTSLFGAVFIIAYETGKVVEYIVLSKYCVVLNIEKNRTSCRTNTRIGKPLMNGTPTLVEVLGAKRSSTFIQEVLRFQNPLHESCLR